MYLNVVTFVNGTKGIKLKLCRVLSKLSLCECSLLLKYLKILFKDGISDLLPIVGVPREKP